MSVDSCLVSECCAARQVTLQGCCAVLWPRKWTLHVLRRRVINGIQSGEMRHLFNPENVFLSDHGGGAGGQ